jgi:hypothetical protein
MAGIVPPFCFEFRMRKMVLGKRKGSSRKGPFEILAQKCGSKRNKGQENYRAGSHCEPKAKQSHPPSPRRNHFFTVKIVKGTS